MESTSIFPKFEKWAYTSKFYSSLVILAIIIDIYIIVHGQWIFGLALLSTQIPWTVSKIQKMVREKNENS